ncbi:MAG: hypothetical protein HOH33_15605, partial [Verrucomicrobia bacterium]|nr:hypothetical protein [Verrucomicrobiota bacterium]
VKRNHWIREIRGVYRLARFPESENGQYVIWSLWSRDRKGNIRGVYSHETVLSIYEVSDIMPAKLHMTVPTGFRRGTKIPEILVLHKANLDVKDTTQRQGYRLTTPLRTLFDIMEDGGWDETIIQQAARQFKSKGMLTRKDIYTLIEAFPKSARYFIESGPKVSHA